MDSNQLKIVWSRAIMIDEETGRQVALHVMSKDGKETPIIFWGTPIEAADICDGKLISRATVDRYENLLVTGIAMQQDTLKALHLLLDEYLKRGIKKSPFQIVNAPES